MILIQTLLIFLLSFSLSHAWTNGPLLHNSQNLGTKYGTWGVPGGNMGP